MQIDILCILYYEILYEIVHTWHLIEIISNCDYLLICSLLLNPHLYDVKIHFFK